MLRRELVPERASLPVRVLLTITLVFLVFTMSLPIALATIAVRRMRRRLWPYTWM